MAGLASLAELRKPGVYERVRTIGGALRSDSCRSELDAVAFCDNDGALESALDPDEGWIEGTGRQQGRGEPATGATAGSGQPRRP